MSTTASRVWMATFAAAAVLLHDVRIADACGCLSPPAVTEGEYAVNQRAEQIIFEVEPGWVTAHVLISYAGEPASFAWIVPVPEVPELGVSPVSAFGLLDRPTAPQVTVDREDICPTSAWSCKYHPAPDCGGGGVGCGGGGDSAFPTLADAGAVSDAGGGAPPVTVLDQQVVGDYQAVTFRANEATAATQWLRSNGFIVNTTTSIYMEPYVQANMVFVAIKLVPGAGVQSIKPLKLRYRAAYPMIPLVLTAVAAQPHLTVTAYIYSDEPFRPMGHPLVTIDPERIATDAQERLNYPMVLARTVDDAGGDAFAVEYRGSPVRPEFGQGSMGAPCCDSPYDFCGIGGNDQCECPRDEFDRTDCTGEGDLVEGVALLDDLASRYTKLTRLTTRISPEEMRFDPTFEPDHGAPALGRVTIRGAQPSLAACRAAVIDDARYAEITALQSCAALYCGPGGTCVTTATGAGCACGPGTVAQQFIDVDGKPSVTCVPETPTCDLRAGGDVLPDACANVSCGAGTCEDRNGVPVCACNAGAAAVTATSAAAPRCTPIQRHSQTPGAEDFSEPLRTLDVCAPPPPTCGPGGWLVRTGTNRPGVACDGVRIDPAPAETWPPPAPDCDGTVGCGGCQHATAAPLTTIVSAWGVLLLLVRRRRRGRR